MPRRREQVEGEQAGAAGVGEGGDGIAEEAHQAVGEADRALAVEAPGVGVAGQGVGGARVAVGAQQHLGEGPHVAQGQVVALASHRVEGLGGVAEPHGALADGVRTVAQLERVAGARADRGKVQAVAEVGLQAGPVGVVVEGHQGVGFGRVGGVHDRAVVAAGQHGQRALGGEALPGPVGVALDGRGDADHRVLGVVALDELGGVVAVDAAFGAGHQAGRQRVAAREADDHVVGAGGEAGDAAVVEDGDAGGGEGVVEGRGQIAGGDHVAHRRQAVVGGAEQAAAEAALLGDVDGLDGRGAQLRPHAEPLEGQPAAVGEGQHAGVVARGAAGAGVHQQDVEPGILEGQRQGHAHRAGADDDQVMPGHGAPRASGLRFRRRSWAWRW